MSEAVNLNGASSEAGDALTLKTGVALVVNKAKKITSAMGSPLAPIPISALLQVLIENPAFKDRATRTAVLSECVHKTRGLFRPHPAQAFALQWRSISVAQHATLTPSAMALLAQPTASEKKASHGTETQPQQVQPTLPLQPPIAPPPQMVQPARLLQAPMAVTVGGPGWNPARNQGFRMLPQGLTEPAVPPAQPMPAVPAVATSISIVGTPRAVCVTGPLHRALFHPTSASSELREKLNKALEGDKATAELLALFAEVPEGVTPDIMKDLDCTTLHTKLIELSMITAAELQKESRAQPEEAPHQAKVGPATPNVVGGASQFEFLTERNQADSYVGNPTHVCIGGWLYHVLQHPEVCPRSKVVGFPVSDSVAALVDMCLQAGNGVCPPMLLNLDCTPFHKALKAMKAVVAHQSLFRPKTQLCLERDCCNPTCIDAHSIEELRPPLAWIGFVEAPFITGPLRSTVKAYLDSRAQAGGVAMAFGGCVETELAGVLENDPTFLRFVEECIAVGSGRIPASYLLNPDAQNRAMLYGKLCELAKRVSLAIMLSQPPLPGNAMVDGTQPPPGKKPKREHPRSTNPDLLPLLPAPCFNYRM